MHEPRYGLAVLIGAVCGTPGAEYLLALHHLVTGKYPTAVQAAGVLVFCIINFALVIIPFVFFVTEPAGAGEAVKRFKVWLTTHERQIAGAVALIAGGYMVISGLARRRPGLPIERVPGTAVTGVSPARADHGTVGH